MSYSLQEYQGLTPPAATLFKIDPVLVYVGSGAARGGGKADKV